MRKTFLSSTVPHKVVALLLLLVSITGCVSSTKYTSSIGGCPTALVSGEKVLMGEAVGISANQSYELYQKLEPQVREAGLKPAYAVEQDIYLRMHGIRPEVATDTSSLAKMQQMGYAYYLKLTVGSVAEGLAYASYSADEIRQMEQYNNTQDSEETKATVRFDLYSTHARKLVYTLTATTEMSGISLPNDDYENGYRGKTTVNISTIPMTVDKAVKKGTKRLLENCKCCQGPL